MFFFKDLEENDNYNVMKKNDAIQELISITELQKKNSENSPIEIISKNSKIMKNFPPKKKETERQGINDDREDRDENQKEIQIYNSRNNNRPSDSKQTKTSSYMKGRSIEENKDYNKNRRNQYNEKYSGEDSDENYPRYNSGRMKKNRNSSSNLNFRNNDRNDEFDFNDSIGTNMDDYSESERPKRRRKKSKVENDFNIFEVIISQFLCCFMSKNLKLKNSANEKAREILFKQMDINTYVYSLVFFY